MWHNGVVGRTEVSELAKEEPKKALQKARNIEHPWYRCQAISSIVEANPSDPGARSLLDEAFAAAYAQHEPNRVASVAFWPLRLLVGISPCHAVTRTKELLQVIAREPHGLRRLDGLQAILAATAASGELRQLTLAPFLAASQASQGWRTERIVNAAAEALIPFDRSAAMKLLSARSPSRYTRRSRALLSQPMGANETDA